MKTIVDGLAVEYRDEGQGSPLLILHGWMSSLGAFDALTKILSSEYRIVRLDLPGFGGSEMPPKPWHVSDYAQFTGHFLEKLQVKPAALVGHSFGGRIMLKGLAEHTLTAQKAIFIASAGAADKNALKKWSFMVIAKAGRAATSVPPFTRLRTKLRGALYSAAKSDYGNAGALTPTYVNVVGENLAPLAPLVKIPALLIWGARDKTTPLSEGRRLQALMPNAALEVIDDAGHFVQQEKPEQVAAMIRAFL